VSRPRRTPLVCLGGVAVAALLVVGGLAAVPGLWSPAGPGPAKADASTTTAYARLPMRFEPNQGQAGDGVRFLARAAGTTAYLSAAESVLRAGQGEARMRLVGADPDAPATTGRRLAGVANYLKGDPRSWVTGVPGYDRVRFEEVYPGIDLVYRSAGRALKYDLVVAPGADPSPVVLDLEPSGRARIDGGGDIVIATGAGEVRHEAPVVYQPDGRHRDDVAASYTRRPDGTFGFRLGNYDPSRPLVIDPAVVYSTLFGGVGAESSGGIAADGAGNAYLTGQTAAADLPLASPLQGARQGASDAFVTKLNPAGTALVYSTYLGGSDAESGLGIALDAGGSAFVTGSTASTNFPVTVGALQTTKGATGTDAFVAKLNPAGSALTYATYLGGASADVGRGIAVDGAGNAYVTGEAASTNFPVTGGAFQTVKGAGTTTDAFVTKLNAAGTALVHSTFLGGGLADVGRGIAVDGDGSAYVTGDAASTNFPTAAPIQAANGGSTDAFATKLNAAGAALAWSTYLGGGGADVGRGIALDPSANAYVAGSTASDNFPLAAAFQGTKPGGDDGFVTKVVAAGSSLAYSTYLGGLGPDSANAVAVDAAGSAHVAGATSSTDFPTAAPVAVRAGSSDAFVTQLTPAGNGLVHSAPFGGSAADDGTAIALDPTGTAYLAGQAAPYNDDDFPTVNAFRSVFGGGNDAFVAKIAPTAGAVPLVTALSPRSGPAGTTVLVNGSALSGTTAVRFGTVAAASFTVLSATQIRAVAPDQAAAAAAVTVTTAGGTSPANPVARYTYAEGTWEFTGAQAAARVATRSVLLADGRVLLAGGRDRQNGTALASAEIYDPKTGTWTLTGSMTVGRTAHTATLLNNGKVLVTGGATGNVTTNAQPQLDSAELFDPATGTWAATGSMAARRYLHSAHILRDGRVLVAGGRTCNAAPPTACDFSQFTNTAEVFDPATGTFALTGSMAVPRHTTEATMLNDGRILIPAGFGGPSTGHASADVFDPATGTWSPTGPMNIGRSRQGAVTLRDGRVLVAGGFSGSNTAELYDPATNAWTLTGSPNSSGRNNFFMGLVPNGRVLLAGGGPGGFTAELFDPGTGRWRSAGTMHTSRGIAGTPYNSVRPVVLSSDPNRLEADPSVCGSNCLKLLLAGESEDRRAELYVPAGVVTDKGYWTVASDGGIFAFGGAQFYGSTGALRLNQPVVGMAATPSGKGYWLVARDGGIFAFGDAQFYGSTGAIRLNQPVVGMAATPSGKGYWMVASDGGIFAFGDAQFYGSTGAIRLNQPVVGMAGTPTGRGYWLAAADGGIFAFGNATFRGSMGGTRLNRPVVGMSATPTGRGYALVATDGGIFAFGDAVFHGSTGAIRLNQPMVGMAPTPSNGALTGYWLVASDGGIFAFGDAPFLGSTGAIRLNQPMVGMAPLPRLE
jgi:hypothetical protein